jgi:hypothetical protein
MRKVALALALLFCADVAIDSFDSDCVDANADACHACLCQTHAVTHKVSTSEKIDAPKPAFMTSAFETFADRLTDKSFFQPPKALA